MKAKISGSARLVTFRMFSMASYHDLSCPRFGGRAEALKHHRSYSSKVRVAS